MSVFPFFALIVISLIYRGELGARSLLVYWGIWAVTLAVAMALNFQPGFYVAFQAILAVAMLVQLRINPAI